MPSERITAGALPPPRPERKKMKRAIVTGATGAIGTALVSSLAKSGTEVLVIARKGSKRNVNIPDDPLVSVIYCPLEELKNLNNDTGKQYDVFYHLAWAGTTGAERNDMQLQNRNVSYALDAVALARRFGCHSFVGAGSQAEYGRTEGNLRPDTPVSPETGYGIAKLCAGQMTREYAHQLGMRHIWVRVLSVYGPYDTEGSMVMSTIRQLKKNQVPEFTRAEQMWDYLYSVDAGRAFAALGEKGVDGKIYVLGSGNARPLSEYIEAIRDICAPGAPIAIGARPYARNQVMYLCADISDVMRDTGWKPEVSFEDGIRGLSLTWGWTVGRN